VDYILFFEKTTHFNEKLYLGFKPHFSLGVHPEIYSQPFTNTLYSYYSLYSFYFIYYYTWTWALQHCQVLKSRAATADTPILKFNCSRSENYRRLSSVNRTENYARVG
jgi:hypothetical protein